MRKHGSRLTKLKSLGEECKTRKIMALNLLLKLGIEVSTDACKRGGRRALVCRRKENGMKARVVGWFCYKILVNIASRPLSDKFGKTIEY